MSKYNKSLPKPTDIVLMDSKRANRKTTVTMPFGGVIPSGPSYLGWRQSSFTYSYQVQYYVNLRAVNYGIHALSADLESDRSFYAAVSKVHVSEFILSFIAVNEYCESDILQLIATQYLADL